MNLKVCRTRVRLNPDVRKVIPRFFNTGEERGRLLISRVLLLSDDEVNEVFHHVQAEFNNRYSNIRVIFEKHFENVKHLLSEKDLATLSVERKQLIGSYFSSTRLL
jgi:hypothetical protein